MRETDVFLKGYHYVICIRSFLQEIRFLSLSYWWSCLLCSHWNHLFLSYLHPFMCIYAMNWMNFLFFWFCFISCSFWWSYNNTVVLFCQYIFVFYINIFVYYLFYVFYILLFICIFNYFLLIYPFYPLRW